MDMGASEKFFGLAASRSSKSVVHAAMAAKACGLKVIRLAEKSVCKLDEIASATIYVLEMDTYKVQVIYLQIYPYFCHYLEKNEY
jgi:D-sedoheptulose 7-phosphate isomerase